MAPLTTTRPIGRSGFSRDGLYRECPSRLKPLLQSRQDIMPSRGNNALLKVSFSPDGSDVGYARGFRRRG